MLAEDLLCEENENALLSPSTRSVPCATGAVAASTCDPSEVFSMMLANEARGHHVNRNADYLNQVQRHGMEMTWRCKIAHWMFETGKAFDLAQDTVGCAIIYMDQYLSLRSVDKLLLQLVSMVCLYVASKIHEPQPISMEEMDLLSQSKFTREQVRQVEAQLAQLLGWKLHPLTSFSFARDFISLLKLSDTWQQATLQEEVLSFLQDVNEDYSSVRFKSSNLGVAAVFVVWKAKRYGPTNHLQEILNQFDGFPKDSFVDCYRMLLELYLRNQNQQSYRFVSVEESKMEPTNRSESPTSVEDTAHFASISTDADERSALKRTGDELEDLSSDESIDDDREPKRVRHNSDLGDTAIPLSTPQ